MNILTNPSGQSNSVSFTKTSETKSTELASPANMLARKWKLNGAPVNGIKEPLQSTNTQILRSTESIEELQDAQNPLSQSAKSKLGLQKLPSNVSASAFTPVYKNG